MRDDPASIEAACYFCQVTRNAGLKTDAQVRRKAWYFWSKLYPERYLRWLRNPDE